jgi:uncharacterized membrane protein HdeD (DUF308 family)
MDVPTAPDAGSSTEQSEQAQQSHAATLARLWWLSALRGLVALVLALAVVVAGRGTARLVTFLGLYWMVGGLITLRFALAIRPRRGTRLALIAGIAAVVGAVVVLLRDLLDGLVDEDLLIRLLGVSAILTGLLRVLGGFAAERQFGRRWTMGGIVLGTLEIALGGVLLLTMEVNADVLVPVAAGWGVASGSLLLAEGLRLRRLARTWRPDVGQG